MYVGIVFETIDVASREGGVKQRELGQPAWAHNKQKGQLVTQLVDRVTFAEQWNMPMMVLWDNQSI